MKEIISRNLDYSGGLSGCRVISGTSPVVGGFQSFLVNNDSAISVVLDKNGIDLTASLGLTGVTLKQGTFVSLPAGNYFSSITLASGSVIAYNTIGVPGSFSVATVDPDAQAFITAAGITDATQQSAINTLVVELKAYGIWTKMKAIYPFVGGTSSTHKWNLKDPRDLDAAFRLVFSGGWTHSSTGALPNGTNAYADSKLNSLNNTTLNSTHFSYYSRTNSNATEVEISSSTTITGGGTGSLLEIRTSGVSYYRVNSDLGYATYTDANSLGFYIANRTASNVINGWKNGSKVATATTTSKTQANINYWIGALNQNNVASLYTTKECAFASIGDGLTDTEATNLYTAIQAYQTTLGRSVGTQTVSDADAQAFVNAAVIEDQVQATAINTLVTDLKGYGIWSKMKAIYPFVGGTASTHKWNLKDPRDLDAAFRLVFSGGWTHSSTGATPNGTNAYANTYLKLQTNISATSHAFGIYSRTNNTTGSQVWGSYDQGTILFAQNNLTGANFVDGLIGALISYTANPTTGLILATRRSATDLQAYRNNVSLGTNTTNTTSVSNLNMYLAARNNTGAADLYSQHQLAFSFFSDGLTDTEAANLYTAVQAYQTTLSRNV